MKNMEARYREIESLVDGLGYRFDAIDGAFYSTDPDEADNNLSVEWKQMRQALGNEVGEEEFRDFVAWKQTKTQ